MSRDEFFDALGGEPGDPGSSEDFFDLPEIGGDGFRERLLSRCGKMQTGHRIEVSFFEALEFGQVGTVLTGREFDQSDEGVGNAAHRRNHHGRALARLSGKQNSGGSLIALRVGEAGAAKFVNDPSGDHLFVTRF